jgi:hypothetical protein
MEIQSTLREPPKAAIGMKKSLWGGERRRLLPGACYQALRKACSPACGCQCAEHCWGSHPPNRRPPPLAVAGLGTAFSLYLSVAITSYMALGNSVPGDVLTGFSAAPLWLNMLANAMVLVHMVAAVQVCGGGCGGRGRHRSHDCCCCPAATDLTFKHRKRCCSRPTAAVDDRGCCSGSPAAIMLLPLLA